MSRLRPQLLLPTPLPPTSAPAVALLSALLSKRAFLVSPSAEMLLLRAAMSLPAAPAAPEKRALIFCPW